MSGKCYYCNKELDKRAIKRHLSSCKTRKERVDFLLKNNSKLEKYYMVEIWFKYNKSDYWMYVSCNSNSELGELDKFLRDVWLECCNHLSDFTIDGLTYNDDIDDEDDFMNMFCDEKESMEVKLKEVFEVGTKFKHRYDFGDTTELEGKVVDEFMYKTKNNKIEIMARNNDPVYGCFKCGSNATFLNPQEGFLCSKCAKKAEWVIDLGNLSSPRSGVCGYKGTRKNENSYIPHKIN